MKRRASSRRQVLDLDANNKSNSPKWSWHTKYQQICLEHSESQNGAHSKNQEKESKSNALQGLVGSYDSDSDEDENKNESGDLDAKVENFLKEISEIVPSPVETKVEPTVVANVNKSKKLKPTSITTNVTTSSTSTATSSVVTMSQPEQYTSQMYTAPYSSWQECYDESTGCYYYWNVETNAVTWDMPPEVQAYKIALEQWKAQQLIMGHGAAMQSYMSQVVDPNAGMMMHQEQELSTSKTNKVVSQNKRKAKKGVNSDSEDEKIEMITSYGPTSGESESEDETLTKPPSLKKKKPNKSSEDDPVNSEDKTKVGPQLPNYVLEDSNSSSALQSLVSYGPDPGPPGTEDHEEDYNNSYYKHTLLSNVPDTGPPGEENTTGQVESSHFDLSKSPLKENLESEETESVVEVNDNREEMIIIDKTINAEKTSALQRLKSLKKKGSNTSSSQSGSEEENVGSEADGETTDEDVDESLILDRLRSQARVLQDLGGEIPDEIKDLIEPEENQTNKESENQPAVKVEKDLAPPTSFSLIAGYGDDSDPEDEPKSEEQAKEIVKPLFPIVEPASKDIPEKSNCVNNLKVIKLSARAKALIKASNTTGKARATDFVNTSEGLKPADTVTPVEKEHEPRSEGNESATLEPAVNQKSLARKKRLGVKTTVSKPEVSKTKESKMPLKSEVSKTEIQKTLKPDMPSKSTTSEVKITSKQKSHKLEIPSKVTNTEINDPSKPSTSLGYTSAWSYGSEQTSGERRGFGFSSESQTNKPELKRTPIQFIKAETLMPPKIDPKPVECNHELSKKQNHSAKRKEVLELSQLISEKVKFLGEGKEAVPPVQSMAIQIETLVTAWEEGGLSLQYMSSWLMAMDAQLSGLEQAAAPKGWLCEWNRYVRHTIVSFSLIWKKNYVLPSVD